MLGEDGVTPSAMAVQLNQRWCGRGDAGSAGWTAASHRGSRPGVGNGGLGQIPNAQRPDKLVWGTPASVLVGAAP